MRTMKRLWWLAAVAALLSGTLGGPGTARAAYLRASMQGPAAVVDVSYFYDALAPYGRWIDYPSYGWCWTPTDVPYGWRPYTDGYWVYTDFGWTWVSYDPWGWAAFHYGRWLYDPFYGWIWVPGTIWGPAWVAWREGDDCVGWAPLPPVVGWDVTVGLRFGDYRVTRIPPRDWCFVPRRELADANLRFKLISVARNVTLLPRTRDVTRFEVREGRPVNRGIDVAVLQRLTGREVRRMKVLDVDSPGRGRGQIMGGGTVGFFRPAVRKAPPGAAPRPEGRVMGQPARPVPELQVQRDRERERHKLESDLLQERAQLQREQQEEVRAAPRSQATEELRRRHEIEQQAFEQHAAEQRQLLEHREQLKPVQRGRPEGGGQAQTKGKGQEKSGQEKKKGDRGKD